MRNLPMALFIQIQNNETRQKPSLEDLARKMVANRAENFNEIDSQLEKMTRRFQERRQKEEPSIDFTKALS